MLSIEEQSKSISNETEFQNKLHSLHISGSQLKIVEEFLRNQFRKDFDEKSRLRSHKKRRASQICDFNEPICYEYMEEARNKKESLPAFVFRPKEKNIIIHKNYLLNETWFFYFQISIIIK